jgi:hypothetical protein
VIIFAISDKGGTGRSVTSSNLAYRKSLQGSDVAYLDFDFGSPTAGAIFGVGSDVGAARGQGMHSFLQGRVGEPVQIDVWRQAEPFRDASKPDGAGRLVLFPGDEGGGEFPNASSAYEACSSFFLRLEEEFDLTIVDLSAGRSFAVEMVLEVTGRQQFDEITCRWLVFHRWTRQHIVAASGLVFGENGILKCGESYDHNLSDLRESIRFVRTAVLDIDSSAPEQYRAAQVAWIRKSDRELNALAASKQLRGDTTLGRIPLDPVLQWREQLITDVDVSLNQVANRMTLEAFDDLARRLTNDEDWVVL